MRGDGAVQALSFRVWALTNQWPGKSTQNTSTVLPNGQADFQLYKLYICILLYIYTMYYILYIIYSIYHIVFYFITLYYIIYITYDLILY